MNPPNTFTAVIAAAGLSSRMGTFKPALPLGEGSISRRLISSFIEAGSLPVTVVTGHMAGTLARHLDGLPVRLVHNKDYQTSEMFDSLRLGLASLDGQGTLLDGHRTSPDGQGTLLDGQGTLLDGHRSSPDGQGTPLPERIFLCPADIPLIRPETIALMARQEADVVIPVCGGRKGHPVCVSSFVLPEILAHDGTDGLRGVLRTLRERTLFLAVPDAGILADADTVEDYRKICESYREVF